MIKRKKDSASRKEQADLARHYLLAAGGINAHHIDKFLNDLRGSDIQKAVLDVTMNVEAFVRHHREKNILAVIELRRQQADADFRFFIEKHMRVDWETQKEKFSTARISSEALKRDGTSSSGSGTQHSTNRTDGPRFHNKKNMFSASQVHVHESGIFSWDSHAQTFAQACTSINEHRLMQQPLAICSLMAQLTSSITTEVKGHQLADSWQILAFLVDEKHLEHGRETIGTLLQPRHYARQYYVEGSQLRLAFAQRARRYLEHQFFLFVEREIARSPDVGRLGGVPTAESKIRAYANVRLSKNGVWIWPNIEIINNVPMWAILFYLVRAGYLAEAVLYSKKNETVLTKVESHWCAYIAAYQRFDGRLPRHLAERMHNDFNQRIKFVSETTDPFKHALFKIIGRCELSHKSLPDVLPVAEDWLWLQLVLIHENGHEETTYESYTISDLQYNLRKFGSRHFNPMGTNPMLYFQLLMLSGQFEHAINYLTTQTWTDAVHFAIVLMYYGCLKTIQQNDTDELLVQNATNSPELNFSAMMVQHAAYVQGQNPSMAVEYLCFMCLDTDANQDSSWSRRRCHDALRDLILNTRAFAALLGDVKADGAREPGFIDRRMRLLELENEEQYLKTITEHAGSSSENDGRLADAILLYHLSAQYDMVVALINSYLGEALLDPSYSSINADSPGSSAITPEDPAVLAQNMLDLYTANSGISRSITKRNKDNCTILLAIVQARHKYEAGLYDACLSVIDNLGMIPMAESLSIATIRNLSQHLNILDDCVTRNMPGLLVLVVKCLVARHQAISRASFNDPTRAVQLASIRKKAKNLSTFIGLLKYQINESHRLVLEEDLGTLR